MLRIRGEKLMPSKQAAELRSLYQNWVSSFAANPQMPLNERRDLVEQWPVVTGEPGGVDYLEVQAGGVPAMWAVPGGVAKDRVLLCLHGGGFVSGSMYTHRKYHGHLAKAIGCRALTLNFRRTPEYAHPAQIEDAIAAYRWLLGQGIKPRHIAFVGDSAGGGLVVSALVQARTLDLEMPTAVLLLSPWLDMELSGDTMVSNRGKDALFSGKEAIEPLVGMYLGGRNPSDALASPINADFAGFPPFHIQVGEGELLLDDSRRLAERARKAGVGVRLEILSGLEHCFLMSAGRAPEADAGIQRWAEWARPKLGLASRAQSVGAAQSAG